MNSTFKIVISFLLVFLFINNYAQTSPENFWKHRCVFNTDGSGKSLGLKIRFSIPCEWEQIDGDRPHIVKKFSYSFADGSSIVQTLLVNKMPRSLTKEETNEMFTQSGLKEVGKSLGTFISGRKLLIDGLDCGEVTFKFEKEAPIGKIYGYVIQYFFFYKNKMIVFNFGSGSSSNETSKSIFETHKTLFKGIAGTMVFISKWE